MSAMTPRSDIGIQTHGTYPTDMKVVKVPDSIRGKEELIEHFAKCIPFPGFYSLNWDSFDSCLNEILENDALDFHVEHIGWTEKQYRLLHPYRQILLDALFANGNFTVKF